MIRVQQHSCRICWQLNVRTPSFAKLLKTKSNFRGHQETQIRPFWGNPWVSTIIVKARNTTVSNTYLRDAMNIDNTSPNHAKMNPKLQWYVFNNILAEFVGNSTSKHLHLQNYSKQNPIFEVTRKPRYDHFEVIRELPRSVSRPESPPSRSHICVTPWTSTIPHQIMLK